MNILLDPHAWVQGVVGGLLIGLSAAVLLVVTGRIAGISGILSGALFAQKAEERLWRLIFLVGLVVGGSVVIYYMPASSGIPVSSSTRMSIAGLLVGIGTRLGGGCTSGHGVCGLARLSKRSLVATLIFMGAAVLTVLIIRRVGGLL